MSKTTHSERVVRAVASLRPRFALADSDADTLDAFLRSTRVSRPDRLGEVFLIARRRLPKGLPPWPGDTESVVGWIYHDVHMYYDGPGFAAPRVLSVMEQYFKFEWRRGRIDEQTFSDVADEIDHERFCRGIRRKRDPRGAFVCDRSYFAAVETYQRTLAPELVDEAWVGATTGRIAAAFAGRPQRCDAISVEGVHEVLSGAGSRDPNVDPARVRQFNARCVGHLVEVLVTLQRSNPLAIREDVHTSLCAELRALQRAYLQAKAAA